MPKSIRNSREEPLRDTFVKIRDLLPMSQQRHALWLFGLMTLVAFLELVSVASIIPFIVVISDTKVLHNDGWLARMFAASGMASEQGYLIVLGIGVLFALIVVNASKAFATRSTNRFVFLAGEILSTQLLRTYLERPYKFFLTRHSADLGRHILAETQQVINGVIQPAMVVASRGLVALFLALLLVVADPVMALASVIVVGGSYGLLYALTRVYVGRTGQQRIEANRERFRLVSELFGGIKEVKLRGLEDIYSSRYSKVAHRVGVLQAANQTLTQVPRYGLEVIAFAGILFIVLYQLAFRGSLGNALPLMALYTFAGYRLLPVFQEIFASVTKIRFNRVAVDQLHRDMADRTEPTPRPLSVAPLSFNRQIELSDVTFMYPESNQPNLRNINLVIRKGQRVGFIGPTGAGKSTIVDLILGLLSPTTGAVLVDQQPLDTDDVVRSWQTRIGYVPQHIFLADESVLANIAFGRSASEIDRAAVERAARIAEIHNFIVNELPQGYETPVGERGIRLSGGQRQRIGLARALYGDPAVLVLDEATSALDTETEDAVIAGLNGLNSDCTVIMIAHRLSTVRRCDVLFKLERGLLVKSGSVRDVLGDVDAVEAGSTAS
jgi:ABC-type bacteriocin/lantibiotic exporter with double-glycine peptidase domain